MKTYLVLFGTALCSSLVLTPMLGALFDAVEQLLVESEFDSAVVVLGGGDSASAAWALNCEHGDPALPRALLREGYIYWVWERRETDEDTTLALNRLWTLHLPLLTNEAHLGYIDLYPENHDRLLLVDFNCLSAFFQQQLARAAERILGATQEQKRAA